MFLDLVESISSFVKKPFCIQISRLREINIKYCKHYYPDAIINIKDLDLDKILVYARPYQNNNFIYCVEYKIPHVEKPLNISFDAVGGSIENLAEINIFHYSILTKTMKEC